MTDKCRRAKGATLILCESAAKAVSSDMVQIQHMRNSDTGKLRERLSIVKGKKSATLYYCPWCRADIDTRPRERATQASKQGEQA